LRAKKKILAVGLGYSQQAVLFNLPSESHDEKLDWVITPQKAHDFWSLT
jgi:5-formyltetrahydrofolate cyclo-ligase